MPLLCNGWVSTTFGKLNQPLKHTKRMFSSAFWRGKQHNVSEPRKCSLRPCGWRSPERFSYLAKDTQPITGRARVSIGIPDAPSRPATFPGARLLSGSQGTEVLCCALRRPELPAYVCVPLLNLITSQASVHPSVGSPHTSPDESPCLPSCG